MPERVSNTDIRLRIRLCENSLGRGDPHHMALLDLLDARDRIREAAEIFTLVLEDVTYFPGPGMRRWLEAVGRRG